jgi:hypothetical protein
LSEKAKSSGRGGIRKCLPVFLEALKKGMVIEALRDTEECKHDTLYYLKDILHNAELIFEERGKWYYTWKRDAEKLTKDYQKLSKKDLELNLRHSEDLVKHAVKMDESGFNLDIYSLVFGERFNLFRQHLQTGYPNILKTLNRAEEQDAKMKEVFLNIYEEMKRIASDLDYEVNDYDPPSQGDSLKQELHKRKLTFGVLTSSQAKTEGQWDLYKNEWIPDFFTSYSGTYKEEWGRRISMHFLEAGRSQGEDIEICGSEDHDPNDFIDACKASEEIKRLHSDFLKSYQEANYKYKPLVDELKPIIRKITIGVEPLLGDCDECPKVIIEEGP